MNSSFRLSSIVNRFLLGTALLAPQVSASLAQQPPSVPSPNLAGIAHVAVRVANLDASIAFYEKLGFVKAFALSREGKEYEAFIKINDRQYIELYPATEKETQLGFLHVCFEGSDLHAAHDFYVAHGLSPNDVRTAGAGNLLFTMAGPATPTGPQNLEYTQYMPGSLHSKDFGQHLGADRIGDRISEVAIASDDPAAAKMFYINKMSFSVVGGKNVLAIPGGSGERLEIVPDQPLGFKARIAFAADPGKVAGILKKRGIPFAKAGHTVTLTDPDANQIVLAKP